MMELSLEELDNLMCKNCTSSSGNGHGGTRYKPYAFMAFALRPTLLYANQERDSIIQSGWIVFQGNSGKVVMLGTQSQPLGEAIPFRWHRWTAQQTRTGMQAHHGQFRHWRFLNGQRIQPVDYASTDNLFYAVNRALGALGDTNFIDFSKRA